MPASVFFRRCVLPGLVFQSVVIAGGYGTGRELAEFFLTQGPRGGLLALVTATVVWSAVCMATFEFARVHRAWDYRHFFQRLLGPGWVVFEVAYVVLLLLVLAVIAAAAGAIFQETFGASPWLGIGLTMAVVAALVFGGSGAIERAMAGWSVALYVVYAAFFVACFRSFGQDIVANFGAEPAGVGWAWAGLRYAGYNLAVIPAVLMTVRTHERRAESLLAGALAGPLAIIPGLLFYLSMVGQWPSIADDVVPANTLLVLLGSRPFQIVFQVVLFGTLVETGTGLIHAFNERIAGRLQDDRAGLARSVRPAVALGFLLLGTGVSRFGLTGLIASGYGTLTLVFLAVYVVPVLTWGVWRIRRASAVPETLA